MARVASQESLSPPSTRRFYQMRRYQTDPHVFMHELLTAFGDVVRWRGFFDVYLVNHPEYVRRILAQGHENFSKRTIDYRVLARLMGNGLVTNDGPSWSAQRRLMQPLFAGRVVNGFDEVINALTADTLAGWVHRVDHDPLWIDREMTRLAFRIVGRTLFGSDIDRYAGEIVEILEVVNLQPQELRALLTLCPWVPTPHNLRWKRARKRLDEIVHGMIAARRREPLGGDNILDQLINARHPESGEGMSAAQIRDEVVTLMLAGHETSATALTWALHLLGTHPEVQQRLRAILDAELQGAPAAAGDLARIAYLKQVVQESMRLYPPVWAIARRSMAAETLGPYRIPAGSYVGVIIYALHRHPGFWHDPERFDPERFAPGQSGGSHSYSYLPFAAGPRTCIGAGMAMLETQLVLAQLLQRFEVQPVPGHAVETVAKVTLKPRDGLPMVVRGR